MTTSGSTGKARTRKARLLVWPSKNNSTRGLQKNCSMPCCFATRTVQFWTRSSASQNQQESLTRPRAKEKGNIFQILLTWSFATGKISTSANNASDMTTMNLQRWKGDSMSCHCSPLTLSADISKVLCHLIISLTCR